MSIDIVRKCRTPLARGVRRLSLTAVTVASWCVPLAAQSTYPPPFPDPSTCPIKAGIKSFVVEEMIGPTSFSSAFTATFPPAAIAALSNPNVEVHVHITFDTTTMIASNYTIPLPIGSPAITPDTTDFATLSVAAAFAKIDNIYTVCYPRPSILITGHITSAATIFGDQTGIPHGMAFSWDSTNTTGVNNVANILTFDAGTSLVVENSASAIVVPATLTAAIAGSPTITTMYRQLLLDGTPSVSDIGQMTYQWSAPTGVNVGILDPVTAQTRIVINGPPGDYPVNLTVTTPYGTSTSTVTVTYAPAGN